MMKKKLLLFLALIFGWSVSTSWSQDNEFWFVPNSEFGPDCDHNVPSSWGNLHLLDDGGFIFTNATNFNANVNIHFFKTGSNQSILVPAHGSYHFRMDSNFVRTNLQTTYSEAGLKLLAGAHITSDVELIAYYFHDSNANQAMYNLKGADALGTDFYVTQSSDGYYWNGGAPPQYPDPRDMVDIIATENGTQVTIIPTRDIWIGGRGVTSQLANAPYTLTLNRGETFKVMETNAGFWNNYAPGTPNTLAGTHITSSKPIAVTSGEDVTNYDMIGDQLIPIDKGRTLYTVVKGYSSSANSTDRIYLVSATSGTTTVKVNEDGGGTTTLMMTGIGAMVAYNMGNNDTDRPGMKVITLKGDQPFLCYHTTAMKHHPGGGLVPSLYTLSGNRFSFFQMGKPNTSAYNVDNAMNLIYRAGYDTAFVMSYKGVDYKLFSSPTTAHPSVTLHSQGILPLFPGWKYARISLPVTADSTVVTLFNEDSPFSLGYFSGGLTFGQPYSTYGYLTGFKPFQFDPDTVWRCSGTRYSTLVGGFAEYYKWFLPDGTVKEGANEVSLRAIDPGMYILKMNQGQGPNEANWTTDTCWVVDLAFDAKISKSPRDPKPAKVGVPQVFTVDINASLASMTTCAWTFDGGICANLTSFNPTVVWNSTGEKKVTLHLTATAGSGTNQTICDTTIVAYYKVKPKNIGYFVNENGGSDNNDGSKWSEAFSTVQRALDYASQGDYIWVARGNYNPGGDNYTYTIDYDSVQLYGGFRGNETSLSQRNLASNPTTLNGRDNTVITFDGSISYTNGTCGTGTDTRLDGFIIQNGKAKNGAGILFTNGASATIAHCVIKQNTAQEKGGGIYTMAPGCNHASPILVNTEVSGNAAADGAGIYNAGSNLLSVNITISGNSAGNAVGGLYTTGGNPDIRNTIIWGNKDKSNGNTTDVVNNSGIPTYAYSVIGGSNGSGSNWNSSIGTDGGKNKDGGPLFKKSGYDQFGNMQEGNYRLTGSSNSVNSGRNAYVLQGIHTLFNVNLENPKDGKWIEGIPMDLDGMNRIAYDIVDRGAYEYDPNADYIAPIHEVNIPVIENVTTDPLASLHWVTGHENFTLVIMPNSGYSLDYLIITSGSDKQDKKMTQIKNADGSVTIIFHQITEALNIRIDNVSPTSNLGIDGYAVWSYNNQLHVKTTMEGMLKIYNLTGQLYKQQQIVAGEISMSLPQGVYVVSLNDGTKQKIVIK